MKNDFSRLRFGPSQKKVIEYLSRGTQKTYEEIGRYVGGEDLTRRHMRGYNWSWKVCKPLIDKGVVKKISEGVICLSDEYLDFRREVK
jgi:hypothetical protein